MSRATIKDLTWEWRSFSALSNLELHACMALRQEVFIIEQRCFYLDADETDPNAYHLLVWNDTSKTLNKQHEHRELVAYLRAYPQESSWKIGRVLVRSSHRSRGLGIELMRRSHYHLSHKGARGISLAAQTQVIPFYERLGYRKRGDVFMDAGIPHQQMSFTLTPLKPLLQNRTPKVIIFDFDGTLIDSAYDYAICFQTLAKEWDESLPMPKAERISSLMFEGVRPQLEYALGPLDDELFLSALHLFRKICMRTPLTHTALYSGVLGVLERLISDGYQLAICTNRPQDLCEEALKSLGIESLFDLVIGGDKGLERKPSSAMLTAIFDELHVSPQECLFVGDSEVDILAGASAGCPVAVAYWGYTPPMKLNELRQTFIKLEHVYDLLRLLGQ